MEECKDGNNDETMIGRIIMMMMMMFCCVVVVIVYVMNIGKEIS